MNSKKKIYFASDFHLGTPNEKASFERELRIIRWLDEIKRDACEIFLVGDIFDFWFEYKHVIPKNFIRFQAKLIELHDSGIRVHLFSGNHDMWMFDYFEKQLDLTIQREPKVYQLMNHKFYIGHGDGLGPGDYKYKMLKKVFANKLCQKLFSLVPPFIGMGIANFWSRESRAAQGHSEDKYKGNDKEWLYQYCESELQKEHYDFFIFGHRHLPIDETLSNGKSRYINLGDWLNYNSYVVYDGEYLTLKTFKA